MNADPCGFGSTALLGTKSVWIKKDSFAGDVGEELGAGCPAEREVLPEEPGDLQDAHQVETKYPARSFSGCND